MIKDEPKARSAFEAARAQQEKIVQAQPDYGPALCVLGLIDAGLGQCDEAKAEAQRAVDHALEAIGKSLDLGVVRMRAGPSRRNACRPMRPVPLPPRAPDRERWCGPGK